MVLKDENERIVNISGGSKLAKKILVLLKKRKMKI